MQSFFYEFKALIADTGKPEHLEKNNVLILEIFYSFIDASLDIFKQLGCGLTTGNVPRMEHSVCWFCCHW